MLRSPVTYLAFLLMIGTSLPLRLLPGPITW